MKVHYVTYPSNKPWCSDFTAQNLKIHSRHKVIPTRHITITRIEDSLVHIHNVQIFNKWLVTPMRIMRKLHKNGNKVIVGLRGERGLKKYDKYLEAADGVSVGVDQALYDYATELNPNVFILPPGEDPTQFKPLGIPKHVKLCWVGRDNKKFKNADHLNKLGYSYRKATYNNYIPHHKLPYFYNEAYILVNFSDYEGFWRPGIEAAMCGLPIISTDVGVVKEIISPEFIHPTPAKDHLNEYRKQIKWLLENPEEAKRIGLGNLRRAHKYSWANVAPLHDRAWEKILES